MPRFSSHCRRLLFSFLAASLLFTSAHAEDRGGEARRKLWTPAETRLTLGLLGAAGAFSFYDESFRRQARKNRSSGGDRVADAVTALGHPAATLAVGGALWALGRGRQDERLSETGLMALEAVVLAEAGVSVVKAASGRLRPDDSDDAHSFKPFSFEDDRDSMASGHTARAFALASILAKRSRRPLAPYAYYGLATLVGLGRVYQDEHWSSDLIAGALVGELSGRLVLHWNERDATSLTLTPMFGKAVGLSARLRW